jgi:hypothetical protein
MHRQLFKDTTNTTLAFSTKQFQLLPSTCLLCWLVTKPKPNHRKLEIVPDDLRTFELLQKAKQKVEVAMALFTQRGKNRAAQEVSQDGSDDDKGS